MIAALQARLWVALCLLACALVSACGFEPLYGEGASLSASRLGGLVSVSAIGDDRLGQVMAGELRDRLGEGERAKYRLDVGLEQTNTPFAIRPDSSAAQESIIMTARADLVDLATGEAVLTRELVERVSFDLVLSDFAIVTQREDSATRLALRLAERLQQEIALYLRTVDAEEGTR